MILEVEEEPVPVKEAAVVAAEEAEEGVEEAEVAEEEIARTTTNGCWETHRWYYNHKHDHHPPTHRDPQFNQCT